MKKKNNIRGSSLIEVMVMMVIISVAIVGIYNLVNSGQRLAIKTQEQLTATNLARAGLEKTVALRDSFALGAYTPGDALTCFFTADGSNYGGCPKQNVNYLVKNDNSLVEVGPTNAPVCINNEGWFSQENCPLSTPTCRSGEINCRTQFSRSISFAACPKENPDGTITTLTYLTRDCIKVTSKVFWRNQSLSLEQMLTKH